MHRQLRLTGILVAAAVVLAGCDTTLHHPVRSDRDDSGDTVHDSDSSHGEPGGTFADSSDRLPTDVDSTSTGFVSDTGDDVSDSGGTGLEPDVGDGSDVTDGSDGSSDSGTTDSEDCSDEEAIWGAVGEACGECGAWSCGVEGVLVCGPATAVPEACDVEGRCDALACEAHGRECLMDVAADTVRCGDCPEGTRENGRDCEGRVSCRELRCEIRDHRRCVETEGEDAVCGECLPGYEQREEDCAWPTEAVEMILVEAVEMGELTMGSPPGEVGRVDALEGEWTAFLTYDYLIAATPVRQHEWEMVFGESPSRHESCPLCPVENVTWWSALAYANLVTELLGGEPCYRIPAGCVGSASRGTLDCGTPASSLFPGRYNECNGLRLPTEVEWEYAARAGTRTATWAGDLTPRDTCEPDPVLEPIAWTCANTDSPQPVWTREVNPWGLSDMLGNVAELTVDRFVERPAGTAGELGGVMNPWHTPVGHTEVGLRGGSYADVNGMARSAARSSATVNARQGSVGFRLVLTVL